MKMIIIFYKQEEATVEKNTFLMNKIRKHEEVRKQEKTFAIVMLPSVLIAIILITLNPNGHNVMI